MIRSGLEHALQAHARASYDGAKGVRKTDDPLRQHQSFVADAADLMLGAYMAMNDPSGYMVGALFAFMMLSARVAQPLVGSIRDNIITSYPFRIAAGFVAS